MKKYRSKPIEIEAEQYWFGKQMEGVYFENNQPELAFVVTIHGQKTFIQPGDYIVRESDGVHFYPVKPHIFEIRYEEIPCTPPS